MNIIRCFNCNKKVNVYGVKCRCLEIFCLLCISIPVHNCPVNYLELNKNKIYKENPKIIYKKVDTI